MEGIEQGKIVVIGTPRELGKTLLTAQSIAQIQTQINKDSRKLGRAKAKEENRGGVL